MFVPLCQRTPSIGSVGSRQAVWGAVHLTGGWIPHLRRPFGQTATSMKRSWAVAMALVLCVAGVAVFVMRSREPQAPAPAADPGRAPARLGSIGPRLTSNQTSEPLSVYGE